jgi:hypothetical protein
LICLAIMLSTPGRVTGEVQSQYFKFPITAFTS